MLVDLAGAAIGVKGMPDHPALEITIGDDLVLAGPREDVLALVWSVWTQLGCPPMEPDRMPE